MKKSYLFIIARIMLIFNMIATKLKNSLINLPLIGQFYFWILKKITTRKLNKIIRQSEIDLKASSELIAEVEGMIQQQKVHRRKSLKNLLDSKTAKN